MTKETHVLGTYLVNNTRYFFIQTKKKKVELSFNHPTGRTHSRRFYLFFIYKKQEQELVKMGKTNRSAVIAGWFRIIKIFFFGFFRFYSLGFEDPPLSSPGQAGARGGSKTKSALKMEKKIEKKKCVCTSKSSCRRSTPVSFPFWPFLMWGECCCPSPRALSMEVLQVLYDFISRLLRKPVAQKIFLPCMGCQDVYCCLPLSGADYWTMV